MLKELVQSNNKIRATADGYQKELAKYKSEAYELNLENQNLREKLSLYEMRSKPKRANDVNDMQELFGLRKYCKQLEVQLKYTEFEKMKMAKELSYIGNKEPTHPIFMETSVRYFPTLSNHIKKSTIRQGGLAKNERSHSRVDIPTTRIKINNSSTLLGLGSDESDTGIKLLSARK